MCLKYHQALPLPLPLPLSFSFSHYPLTSYPPWTIPHQAAAPSSPPAA